MKMHLLGLTAALAVFGFASAAAQAAEPATCAAAVTHDPVVMRLGKDEFRIAFGVGGERCASEGCDGVIRYHASWKTEDGASRSDTKLLSYSVPRGASRTVAVDRHYFDTAEGKHTTDIVQVNVDDVSCSDNVAMR
ncbi:MAG TPA: hypothetical protein VGC30_10415 [Dokdonella sp.]